MTSQTRTFIEFSDLINLRLECKKCHCSLFVGIDTEDGTLTTLVDKHNEVLTRCPTCGTQWMQFSNASGSYSSEIKEFLKKMAYLRKIEEAFGCKVSFEIKTVAA